MPPLQQTIPGVIPESDFLAGLPPAPTRKRRRRSDTTLVSLTVCDLRNLIREEVAAALERQRS